MPVDTIEAARRLVLSSLRALESSDRALQSVLLDDRWEDAMRTYVEDVRVAREHCQALERLLLEHLQSDLRAR